MSLAPVDPYAESSIVTNAKLAAAEAAADARRDATPRKARPSINERLGHKAVIRRERIAPEDLLRLARDAALLSMRGVMYSAEDRADCAAEITWQALAECSADDMADARKHGVAARAEARADAMTPYADDKRYDLSGMRGRAQNFRRALDRKRAADKSAADDARSMRATTFAASAEQIADRLQRERDSGHDADAAAAAAARMCARLNMRAGGDVFRVLYQWSRGPDATAESCARELGIAAGTFRASTHNAGATLRAAYAVSGGAAGLLDDLLPGVAAVATPSGEIVFSREPERDAAQTRNPDGNVHASTLRDGGIIGGYRQIVAADGVGYWGYRTGELTFDRSPLAVTTGEHWREGTNGGQFPEAPADAADADGRCALAATHRTPMTRKRARRLMWTRDINGVPYRRYPTGVPLGSRSPSKLQRQADSYRGIARALRKPGAKERGVNYRADQYERSAA